MGYVGCLEWLIEYVGLFCLFCSFYCVFSGILRNFGNISGAGENSKLMNMGDMSR